MILGRGCQPKATNVFTDPDTEHYFKLNHPATKSEVSTASDANKEKPMYSILGKNVLAIIVLI